MLPSHKRIHLRSLLSCETMAATLVAGWPPRLFNPLHDTGYERYFRGPSTENWRQVGSLETATSPLQKHYVGGTLTRNNRCLHFSNENTKAQKSRGTSTGVLLYLHIRLTEKCCSSSDICHKTVFPPTENTTLANSESYPDIRQPSGWVSLQVELTFST